MDESDRSNDVFNVWLLIHAYPVGILNSIIVFVDVYFLITTYSKKELFEILEVKPDNKYLLRFVEFYDADIQKFFPNFSYKPDMNTVSFFVLRNMSITGLFLAHQEENHLLKIGLDYVIPEYRDFKNGKYVYSKLRQKFVNAGFTKMLAEGNSPSHIKYLQKLGFKEGENKLFECELVKNR
ncbi:MAG: hypothetical protein AUJ97_04000 [Bacteroidetes bacterium CG2_30_32_10]|nr:MAG: hypothetical protein AUJ97_04000 [Bacteroidetes bacterium CG2_30_32_10]